MRALIEAHGNYTGICIWSAGNQLPTYRTVGKYPENERSQKIQAFSTQLKALQWYMGEAENRNDPYLLSHVASDLALFGGRMTPRIQSYFIPLS